MRFYPLEKMMNLEDGYTRQFKIDALQLLLVQREGSVHLLEAPCPHRGHPPSEGEIADGVMRCPRHNYRFSLQDGTPLQQVEHCRALRVWPLVYEGNEIGVMLPDLAPGANNVSMA